MNIEENPYESSLAKQIGQRVIFALGRVLSQENSIARSVCQTRADLTTGTETFRVTLWLPKVIEITYVQSATNFLNTMDPKSIKAQVLEFVRDGISDVLDKASIKSKVVFTGYRDDSNTARFEVELENLEIVERNFLPRVIQIEYA
jgi:hypothetical protein